MAELLDKVRFEFWKFRDRIAHLVRGKRHVRGVFSRIHSDNLWASTESRSGEGSALEASGQLREQLPKVIGDFHVRTVLDAPCGDFNWMKHVAGSFERYIGVDVVPDLIEDNRRQYGTPSVEFICADITSARLPKSDLVICRDCCIHLPTRLVYSLLRNFRRSGADLVLLSNDVDADVYHDIPVGSFRKVNFLEAPFCFPRSERTLLEDSTGNRQMCLWKLADLPI